MKSSAPAIPLAERMRPKTLSAFIGQDHLLAPGKVLHHMVQAGRPNSIIFWGPPGVGKTSLARVLADTMGYPFLALSAVDSGVKEVREALEKAKAQGGAILFIDEIHRFNRAQQDRLLGAVEQGVITLFGATTENPSFEVIGALLSRCQVYTLKPLEAEDLKKMALRALEEDPWVRAQGVRIGEWEALLQGSGGDGRKLLNLLEWSIQSLPKGQREIMNETVQNIVERRMPLYDKQGDQHYDMISAFIKSIRGSDPNAALYWMARMIKAGEEPRFIARRLVILASEDIGNANPNALLMATTCFQAVNMIGFPEARIILSQCVTYLAASPKSNAAYTAIGQAEALAEQYAMEPVPLSLRNAPTALMKSQGFGKDYRYPHNEPDHFVDQEYMPASLSGKRIYDPGSNPAEARLRQYLRQCWKEKYGY